MRKYFAKLGLNSKVKTIISLNEKSAPTEKEGIEYLHKLHNYPFWIQCSKDGSIRKNGAGVGYSYDEDLDAFIPPSPYPSWVLNKTTYQWEAPTLNSELGNKWDEATTSWIKDPSDPKL